MKAIYFVIIRLVSDRPNQLDCKFQLYACKLGKTFCLVRVRGVKVLLCYLYSPRGETKTCTQFNLL